MRRRDFIKVIAESAVVWPLAAHAQQSERMRRIGILMPLREDDPQSRLRIGAFLQVLRQIGWIEGQTIAFENRFSDGDSERLRAGYIESLAHPGGNITGLTLVATDQSAKRLQLIKEPLPGATRVAVIWNANASGHRLQIKEMDPAAAKLGLVLQSLAVKNVKEIDAALRTAAKASSQAIITMDDPLIVSERDQIIEFGLRQRLPVMGEFRPMTEAGGVMSYGPNQIDMWKRAAIFVDKILKGSKPADMPVERPTKFELVINLRSAKTIGLTVPPMLLVGADEVIE